jgi:DNA-binding response OmpR family regulator
MFTGHAHRAGQAAAQQLDVLRSTRRPRLLLLDGDPAAAAALADALAACRVTAVTAGDGDAGLALLLEELLRLDALVVDLDLPGRDARAFARLVRQAGNEQDLPIVVLADAPSPALRAELRALGVDAVADRREGPAAAAAAALAAIAGRETAEVIELEAWRYQPPAAPLGETSWWSLGGGGLAVG